MHILAGSGRPNLIHESSWFVQTCRRPRLKCDGARTETRFRLSAERTSPFKSAEGGGGGGVGGGGWGGWLGGFLGVCGFFGRRSILR
jgi:hypothetical protein